MQVLCAKCKGKGCVDLPAELESTLKAVKSGLSTTEQIFLSDKHRKWIQPTAIHNRLERLRAFGLIKRERKGKYFHYTTTK